MKSDAPFFRTDIIHMIYLKCEVSFSSLSQQLVVKTTLTTMGHFFTKKLNFCPSDII